MNRRERICRHSSRAMINASDLPVWNLSGLYKGRDDPQIDQDLAEAGVLLESGADHPRAVSLLARLHAFGTLYDGGRNEGALHKRVNAVALRSKVADPPPPGPAPGVDALCTQVAMRGADLWIAAGRPDPHPVTRQWSWEDARALVVEAAGSLAPAAGQAVDRTFREERVHARHPGSPLTHPAGDRGPYVRLDYDGSLKSVLTLAHEMGHAAHQMLSRPLGVMACDPRPALAETAAAVNEQATLRLLIARAGDVERQGLMAWRRRNLADVILRHVMLHRFEIVSRGRPDDAVWLRIVEQTAGLRAARAEKGDGWRAYPVLTRAPGSAWTYAFARLTALALLARREADPAAFPRKWTEFLSAGGTMDERPALWPFLIEPAASAYWQDAVELAVAEAETEAAGWNRRLSLSRPWR
ncbi:MAG: hypothetical protein K1X35_06710 [Caulobacteraceae bacterium]|nr:hypothetical protein [Caulobacteraceae bacterium]